MATIPASSIGSTTPTVQSQDQLAKFADNFQDFLTLLTEQLKHQDPLSPMDSTPFTSQLVQFTGVEQGILQNKNLNQLIALQGNEQMGSAVNYLGKTVQVGGDSVQLSGSSATIDYGVSPNTTPTKVTITITDQSGVTVK